MTLVYGLGRSGIGVLQYLAQLGLTADFFDQNPQPEHLKEAYRLGFKATNWQPHYTQVVAAPGVPINHPDLLALAAGGSHIIGEAELVYRTCPTPIIGITGTAGKTSTTMMTAHYLRALGYNALEGGNIDPPLTAIAQQAEVAVCELSSFQLERIVQFKPKVAVLLNFGVDHLDRHGTLEAYHQAKANLINNLSTSEAVVYNAQDPAIVQAIAQCSAVKIPFNPLSNPRDNNLMVAELTAQAYVELTNPSRWSAQTIATAKLQAPQPQHRFESFAMLGGSICIDDSIATRIDAARSALSSAPSPIAWILGGIDKGAFGANTLELEQLVQRNVGVIYAIGKDGPAMAERFKHLTKVVVIPQRDGQEAMLEVCRIHLEGDLSGTRGHLEGDLFRAARMSGTRGHSEGDDAMGSLLLAPMATSFDQFKDYKARAQAFRTAVFASGGTPWPAQ